jgi:hypothetical protein
LTRYSTSVAHLGVPPGGTTVQKPCPQSAYSATPDQPLAPPPAGASGPGLTDQLTDQPANTGNTFTYTVNLTQCLPPGVSWNSGQEASIAFLATVSRPGAAPDNAAQSVWFKRQ